MSKDDYFYCPVCHRCKLGRLLPQTQEVWIELWCKRCGPVELHIKREP